MQSRTKCLCNAYEVGVETMNRVHTLRSIANDLSREKRTAQAWYTQAKAEHGELGELIDGTRCFNDAERNILLSYAGVDRSAPTKVAIEVGNHVSSKMVHVGASAASLEQFRTSRTRNQLANRVDFLKQVTGFLDQLEEGMNAAEEEAEQELQEIRAVKRQTVKRIDRFRRRADEYRLKTDILASIQNAEIDEIEDLAAEINSLGKSQETRATDLV